MADYQTPALELNDIEAVPRVWYYLSDQDASAIKSGNAQGHGPGRVQITPVIGRPYYAIVTGRGKAVWDPSGYNVKNISYEESQAWYALDLFIFLDWGVTIVRNGITKAYWDTKWPTRNDLKGHYHQSYYLWAEDQAAPAPDPDPD